MRRAILISLGASLLLSACVGNVSRPGGSSALIETHRINLANVGRHTAGLNGGAEPSQAENAVIATFNSANQSLTPAKAAEMVAQADGEISAAEADYINTLGPKTATQPDGSSSTFGVVTPGCGLFSKMVGQC